MHDLSGMPLVSNALSSVLLSFRLILVCCLLMRIGGWFARDAGVLAKVGSVILDPSTRNPTQFSRVLLATDALELAESSVSDAIRQVSSPTCAVADSLVCHR